MQLVVIESPYRAPTPEGRKRNWDYLKTAMLDSMARGECPFASHGLYTHFLNDDVPEERALGLLLAKELLRRSDRIAVYADHGISPGMKDAIEFAEHHGLAYETRYLFGER